MRRRPTDALFFGASGFPALALALLIVLVLFIIVTNVA